uniref:Uncharacterized protein n=1 Tax=Sipha flava TaxID=143950 RepID=A0A2S2QVQ5_9HEMI
MASSIADNYAAVYKKFRYVAPESPSNLIDQTGFNIDFQNRKFINIGLDPANDFNVYIHIITPSRYVSISPDFLKRIYSLMGHILSFVLSSTNNKQQTFLETDSMLLTSMLYRGESVLVIEDKSIAGCRILLNRVDIMALQYLEWVISETILKKTLFVQNKVVAQFEQMCTYFKNEFKREQNIHNMITTIKNVSDDLISSHLPKSDYSFVNQIKLFATKQIAERCIIKIEVFEIIIFKI